MRNEYRVGPFADVHRIVIREAEKNREHANVDIGEITDALANHRLLVAREILPPFDEDEIECLLDADVLANQGFDASDELLIREYRDLHLENRSLFFSRVPL